MYENRHDSTAILCLPFYRVIQGQFPGFYRVLRILKLEAHANELGHQFIEALKSSETSACVSVEAVREEADMALPKM